MGRVALSAVVLCVAACGSSGGSGVPDAGPPDPGPPDAGPPGGGDWRQYRYDARGGSVNPGVFAASEVANLTEFWKAPLELGQYVYTQAVAAEVGSINAPAATP